MLTSLRHVLLHGLSRAGGAVLSSSSRRLSAVKSAKVPLFRRFFSQPSFSVRMPFRNNVSSISSKEYLKAGEQVLALSRQNMLQREIAAIFTSNVEGRAKEYHELESRSLRPSGTSFVWLAEPVERPAFHKEGAAEVKLADKRVLLYQLAALIEKGTLPLLSKVVMVNEGCDNGDFLGQAVPYLKSKNITDLKIVLTEPHQEKLRIAATFAACLTSKDDVYAGVVDAFKETPPLLARFPEHQKMFLFYRLAILHTPSMISDLVRTRLSQMRSADIGVASFLSADSTAESTMVGRYSYVKKEDKEGSVLYSKTLFKKAIDTLKKMKVPEEDQPSYISAFRPEVVKKMIHGSGGEIVQMSTIPAKTDLGHPINTHGVIFKKVS